MISSKIHDLSTETLMYSIVLWYCCYTCRQIMNDQNQSPQTHATTLTMKLVFAAIVVIGAVGSVIIITLFAQSGPPKIVYQPANACDLLTLNEAKQFLGDKALASSSSNPVVSKNTASSKCGYSDSNPDVNSMIVAAIVVRSGINDQGVTQNKIDFANSIPSKNVKTINDLGDKAYFNESLGQLNILRGREWIILSYGVGSTPELNTADKAIELAHKVIGPATNKT